MLEAPLDPELPFADLACFYRSLVASGLGIGDMNTLRKHLSAVKGGRLAQAAAGARAQCTLLISDVPSGQADTIGSGPSLPDSSSIADCRRLLPRLEQGGVPASIKGFFAKDRCVGTPKAGDAAFEHALWKTILSGEDLAQAAAASARARGFFVEVTSECDEWEYRRTADFLLRRSKALAGIYPMSCLLTVGEVSVALPPVVGEGGRNQQFALWCAAELLRRGDRATVLSGGSDGADGNSGAAGAVCNETTAHRAERHQLSVDEALTTFNSGPLLRAVRRCDRDRPDRQQSPRSSPGLAGKYLTRGVCEEVRLWHCSSGRRLVGSEGLEPPA